MRAVIYPRYSSDQQSATSIDDQIRLCKERIAREGWTMVQVYCDSAKSGATALRPGYQAMLEGAREGEFDAVVAEALDRLWRDQVDIAALFKRLQFAEIRLVTLGEGEVGILHIGLKGTMNAIFSKTSPTEPGAAFAAASRPVSRVAATPMGTISPEAMTRTVSKFAAAERSTPLNRRSCARSYGPGPAQGLRAGIRRGMEPAAGRGRVFS